MTVESVFKDLTKVELLSILCSLVSDEYFARSCVAMERYRAARAEVESISKRQTVAISRGDLRTFDELERLRSAADLRARKALAEIDHLRQEEQRQEEIARKRSKPALEPELEDGDEVSAPSSAGRGLVPAHKVSVAVHEAELDDGPAPEALEHRALGLPLKPARLGLSKVR